LGLAHRAYTLPAPSGTPIGAVLRTRSRIKIPDDTPLDLDSSASNWPVQQDRYANGADVYIIDGNVTTQNESQIGYFGRNPPAYNDCAEFTAYSFDAFDQNYQQAGRWFCVQTSDQRFGSFGIDGRDGDGYLLTINVWTKSSDVN
jgi:hypothetical protein